MLEEIDPSFDECPSYCYKLNQDIKENDFCNTCEVGIAKNSFEEETANLLNQRLGKDWEKYGLENLITQVKQTFELKEKPNLSVTAQIMVNILNQEDYRQKRIERYNRKLREKSKE